MKTLVIYDKNGNIYAQVSGEYKIPNGLLFLELEIPKGKVLVSIDVSKKEGIYSDAPTSEIDKLKTEIDSLKNAVDFLLLGGF